jgi:hypothetical protein
MDASMLSTTVAAMLSRELRTFQRELEAYPDESLIWQSHPALPNAGGTLALHAAGNLLHFFGAVYGDTGYVRDRDAEFARRGVPRAELVRQLGEAIDVVQRTCARMTDEQWDEWYPLPVAKCRLRTREFLLHLVSHLAYHLGQLDYHRRVVTGNAQGAGAVSPVELPSATPVPA